MTLAARLAEFAADAEPDPALAAPIRDAVSDCLGCILGGADSEVAGRVRAALGGGAGPVPVLGQSETAAPGLAALRMAVAGHAHDFDDWEEPGNTHPTVVILPALLAAGALAPVPAARFAAAYAVGFEVIARLGQAIGLSHYARGFHTTATLGAIGAAAAAGRALGLKAGTLTHALGLAASQAQGYTLQFGSNAKPLQAGAAARAGIEAALLARAGCTAQPHVLCDGRGLAGLLGSTDAAQIAAAEGRLGRPWALAEFGIVLKPWPSCGYTHRLMTAALALRDRAMPDTIATAIATAEIRAELPDFHRAILPFDRPRSRNEALFSIPACVAQILKTGDLTLDDTASAFWERAEIAELSTRIAVRPEPARKPEMNYDPDQPDRLTVRIGGRAETVACAYPLGAPKNPMSPAQLRQKFCTLSRRPAGTHARLRDWTGTDDISRHIMETLT